MSLDVYLTIKELTKVPAYVPVRENGTIIRMTLEEYVAKYKQQPVAIMEDNYSQQVFSGNITHNLGEMARAADIYECLWKPESLSIESAYELLPYLASGYSALISEPKKYIEYNPANGWGDYNLLINFVAEYMQACIKYPTAIISVWR